MVVHAWSVRAPGQEDYECDALYEGYSNLFSIRLHHGGVFSPSPGRRYVNGVVSFVDFLDIDLMSVLELHEIVKSLGYVGGPFYFHFLDPTSELDYGLYTLGNDVDVHRLSRYASVHKLINVYFEHGITYLDTYSRSPHAPKACKSLMLEWHDPGSQVNKADKVDKLKIRSLSKGKGIIIDDHVRQVEEGMTPNVVEDSFFNIEGSDQSDDSDYIGDEDNDIGDVEVDMRDFHIHVDRTIEYMGPSSNVEEQDNNLDHEGIHVVNTEELESDDETDDDIGAIRKRKISKLRKSIASEDGSVIRTDFYVGQSFSNRDEVKEMIRKHAVETRRELKMVKNDKMRVRTTCFGSCPQFKVSSGPSEGIDPIICPWTLHISKLKDMETWQVKTYINKHTCLQSRTLKACTSVFLSHELVEVIKENPQIPVKALQEQIQRKFEVGVSEMKAFRAKAKAEVILKGDHISQYGILRDYCLEVQKSNPGSTIKISVEEEPNPSSLTRQFKRIYICLGPLKTGVQIRYEGDGAFMKGPFPGQILTAVGLDSNNSIYPVAYSIVEAETINSWTWFLECLGDDLDLATNSNFTFISDRKKGIIPAIAKVFPCVEHRYCLRHINENMKQSWKGKAYKDLLWKCATSTTVEDFERSMQKMKELNAATAEWLGQIPSQHWTRSHFTGRAHCDLLLNNLCEVFNRQLVDGRDKPIIVALEYVREYLMKRIVNVQRVIEKSNGPLTPTTTKTLELIKKEAAEYKVIWNGRSKYQVSGPWMDQCVVDMSEKVCTCRKWELSGILCRHAVATIWNMSLNNQEVLMPEEMVDKAYWLDTWKKVYSFKVGPINGRSLWPKSNCPTTLTAPKHHRPIGRPKKKRRKGIDEGENMNRGGKLSRALKTMTCGKCKQEGHNSRACKGE